jgi:hypothetical protein
MRARRWQVNRPKSAPGHFYPERVPEMAKITETDLFWSLPAVLSLESTISAHLGPLGEAQLQKRFDSATSRKAALLAILRRVFRLGLENSV